MDVELKIDYLDISKINPYKRNAKKHPQKQINQIVKSIEQFGNNDPIAVWGDKNVIVEGHGRYLALKQMGVTGEIPVIHLDHLSEEERRVYGLVHNKLTMNSDFDFDLLELEFNDIDPDLFDMADFGFFQDDGQERNEWFDRDAKDYNDREEGNDEYNEFLDKFDPKKTTDDCYTPDVVYDAVADWVANEYGLKKTDFVRPFYPGGDYQTEKYKTGAVVVDNPPFSILAEIVKYYADKGIKFFLFAPTLTLFSSSSSCCSLCIGIAVTYENGANVNTSFLTNLEPDCRLRSVPTLYKAVKEANDVNLKEMHKELPKYSFPDYVITSTRCGQFSRYGIDFRVPVSESMHIRALDAQKEGGKAVFGSAYLISERLKQEKEKAEREKAEREKAERWELSPIEMEIVKSLEQKAVLGE